MTLSGQLKTGMLVSLLVVVPYIAQAAEFRVGQQLSTAASERVASDFYVAGGNVTTAATVVGDLFVVGGNVLVNGPSTGDLLVLGGSITILGAVGDDLRVAGGNVTISGKVGNDLVVGGGQVNVAAPVGGDILAGAGVIKIDAPVAGDVTVGGGQVFINAPVGGDVHFAGETLTLGSSAAIAGDLTYTSPKEATLKKGAVVRGKTNFDQAKDVRGIAERGLLAFVTLAAVGKFISILVCGFIIGITFSRYSVALVESALTRPFFEIGRGFVTLVMLPVFSIVLLVTVIGIPLGLLGLTGFVALLVFASIIAPIILGSFVYRYFGKHSYIEVSWKTILLGVVLYTVIGYIPYLGALVKIALILLAIGVIAKVKIDIARKWV